jgi:hypothetical protein
MVRNDCGNGCSVEAGQSSFFGRCVANRIIGDFHQLTGTPFRTKDFEVKWSKLSKGEARQLAETTDPNIKTVTIVITGELEVSLAGDVKTLRNEGDYAFWTSDVSHSWEAKTDAFVITIRWPSIP